MAALQLAAPAASEEAAGGAAAAGLALLEGDAVVVREDFASDSDEPAALRRGQTGLVVYVDSDGDAYISFQAHGSKQWVYAEHFGFLALLPRGGGAAGRGEAAPASPSAAPTPPAAPRAPAPAARAAHRPPPPEHGGSDAGSDDDDDDDEPPPLTAAVRREGPPGRRRRWRYAPREPRPLAIRALPDVEGPRTGDLLQPGDTFEVSEERQGAGGARLLRLADGRGWAFAGKAGVGSLCEPLEELGSETATAQAAPPLARAAPDADAETEPPPLVESRRLPDSGPRARSPAAPPSERRRAPAAATTDGYGEPAAPPVEEAPAPPARPLATAPAPASREPPPAAWRRIPQDAAAAKVAASKAAEAEPAVLTLDQAKELVTTLQCACVEPVFEERLQGCLAWARSRPRGKRDAALELRVGELLLETLRPSLSMFQLGRGRRGLQAFFDAIRRHQEDPDVYQTASDIEMVLNARPGGWFGMSPFREGSLLYVKGPAFASEPHLEGAACVLEAWEPRRKRWRVRLVGEDATRLIGEEHLEPGPSPLEREEDEEK